MVNNRALRRSGNQVAVGVGIDGPPLPPPNGLELQGPTFLVGSCPAEAGRHPTIVRQPSGPSKLQLRPSPPGQPKAVRPGCPYRDPGGLPGLQRVVRWAGGQVSFGRQSTQTRLGPDLDGSLGHVAYAFRGYFSVTSSSSLVAVLQLRTVMAL